MYLLSAIPYLCLVGAFILVHWPRFVVASEMAKLPGGYDNNDPRSQQAKLEGRGKRALAAHHNGLEALAFFGISVLAAMQRAVDIRLVAVLSLLFVAARIVFVLAYLRDAPNTRSLMFTIGVVICLILCLCAAFGWPKW